MNESKNLLAEMATSLFNEYCSNQVVLSASEGQWPDQLWRAVEDSGLPHMAVPEAAGGSGASISDAFTVIKVAGRHSAPVPLAETMVASWALAASGQSIPQGPLTFVAAQGDNSLTLQQAGADWIINGKCQRVPWGRNAQHVVVVVPSGDDTHILTVDPDSFSLEQGQNLAGEPRDTLIFSEARLTSDQVATAGPGIDAAGIRLLGGLTRVALMAGGLERALELSIDYVSNRQQFGRPLTKFQAIQQEMAKMAAEVAAVATATEKAIAVVEETIAAGKPITDALFAVAAAKVRAGEAAGTVATIAHQVHGAIGFTYDHQLHLVTRRLWSWRDEFGSETEWARLIGQSVMAAGAEQLWPQISS